MLLRRRPPALAQGALVLGDLSLDPVSRDVRQGTRVVELTALIGYYTMVAMTLNCHDIPLPDGVAPPLPPAPRFTVNEPLTWISSA